MSSALSTVLGLPTRPAVRMTKRGGPWSRRTIKPQRLIKINKLNVRGGFPSACQAEKRRGSQREAGTKERGQAEALQKKKSERSKRRSQRRKKPPGPGRKWLPGAKCWGRKVFVWNLVQARPDFWPRREQNPPQATVAAGGKEGPGQAAFKKEFPIDVNCSACRASKSSLPRKPPAPTWTSTTWPGGRNAKKNAGS